jgi:ABC-2 type transport system ATP-binding protein
MENGEKGIRIENLNKGYGKKQVLLDINLDIPKGKIYGLLGPSGGGKSTLVKIIAGILRQDSGKVTVLGVSMPNLEMMEDIGYMAQAAALYPTLTAYENLNFFGNLYGLSKTIRKDRIKEVAKLVKLSTDLNKKVAAYSGGMKQRLSLAIALLPHPKLLILDEPTVGIDPVLRQEIWEELYNLSEKMVTILLTTHVMDEAEKCNYLALINEGRILNTGTPEAIKNSVNAKNIEEAFIYYIQSNQNKEKKVYENKSTGL